MRVTNATARKKRHKKIIKLAKGYRWGRSNVYRLAKNAVMKAGQNAYRDRRRKKRSFRSLWITRISAALKMQGLRYSEFAFQLANQKIIVNRKILADLAAIEPDVFTGVVKQVFKKT